MFFKRFIKKLKSWLFPAREKQPPEPTEQEETDPGGLVRSLFSEYRLKALLPHCHVRQGGKSARWIIHAANRNTPYLTLCMLPLAEKTVVRRTAERVLTTVTIDDKSSVMLIEYLNPSRVRLTLSEQDEMLLAKMEINCGGHRDKIMEFYVPV